MLRRLSIRPLVALLVCLVATAGLVAATPGRALAGPNEGDFFSAANSARSSAGLPAYAYAGDLAYAARAQAERMAASGQLEHNPDLGGSVSNWQELGENIGCGPDWSSIQQALMNSSEHRAAILDSGYTQMGVGTAVDKDGTLWVSEVFRLPAGATSPAAPSAGSSSNTSTAATTSGTPSATVVAAPTPTQILRSKIQIARKKVSGHGKHGGSKDPLIAALHYSTVMRTVA
ncbi:MAG TPA: CAP domain-containing protein [Actinomycetes bacterium]|nr:CAP domain-containing protein [Actinomycetes bacterium]